jgi:hypothetical protein
MRGLDHIDPKIFKRGTALRVQAAGMTKFYQLAYHTTVASNCSHT